MQHASSGIEAAAITHHHGTGRWGLPVLLSAVFMTTADNSIVNVAVPSIERTLDASDAQLQLTVSGYVLAYAALLVTGARLGTIFGYRRIFLSGLCAFTLASLACGLAPDALTLVAARVVQGIGAALMVPQVLTVIQMSRSGEARTRALALYPVALAGGAAAGQVLGGALLTMNIGGSAWRSIFLVNVPVGIALIAATIRFLPADLVGRRQQLDLRGVAALTGSLVLLVVPLLFARERGWPLWAWLSLASSVPVAALFAVNERRLVRSGGQPLVDVRLLARRPLAWGLAAQAAATVTYAALLFALALYLQSGLGKSPLYSGAALLAWVVGFGLSGPLLQRLPRPVRAAGAPLGFLTLAAAYGTISVIGLVTTPQGLPLIAALGAGGLGMGLGFSALIAHLAEATPVEHAADLSGLLSTNSEASAVVGVATFGSLYLALSSSAGTGVAVDAIVIVAGALAAAAALAGLAALRSTRRPGTPPCRSTCS